jgi:hypothetical protein
MHLYYPTEDGVATPEYVLAVLRDRHRHLVRIHPDAERAWNLTFDSTVADWRTACSLASWSELAEAENSFWGIDRPLELWYHVLEPSACRNLHEVCAFIATATKRPRVRPARLFGSICPAGGVFLTIRFLLSAAGIDVRHLRPSTPLDEFTRGRLDVFLGAITRLAPGALPTIGITWSVLHFVTQWGAVLGYLIVVVGLFLKLASVITLGAVIFALCLPTSWYVSRHVSPASVRFGSLKTFRDLAILLSQTEGTLSTSQELPVR